jgi:hypothetical protein
MMKARPGIVIFFLLVCVLLFATAVSAQWDSDSDDDWSESEEWVVDTDGEGDDTDWAGSAEDWGVDSPDAEDVPDYNLHLEMRLYCHQKDRGDGNYGMFVTSVKKTDEGYLFLEDQYDLLDYGSLPFFPFLGFIGDDIIDIGGDEESTILSWASTPSITMLTSSRDSFTNAKLHRFEGEAEEQEEGEWGWDAYGCVPFLAGVTKVYNGDFAIGFEADGRLHDGNIVPFRIKEEGHDIAWDKDYDQCTAIGGDWTDEPGFEGYRCCGDDSMWINNRAVNEEGFNEQINEEEKDDIISGSVSSSMYCLYGGGEMVNDLSIIDSDYGHYTCSETGYDAYDPYLNKDDPSLTAAESRETFYFFKGTDNDETDVGKWSESDGENPAFCYYEFDENTGESYEWKTNINELGDQPVNDEGETFDVVYGTESETICEKYLGGTWTGSYCCGNKYNYADDSWNIGEEDAYFAESFSDPTPIYYAESSTIITNYACVQGVALNTEEEGPFIDTTGTEIDLVNLDGMLYACNYNQLTTDEHDLSKDYYLSTTGSLESDLIQSGEDENDQAYQASACATLNQKYLCNYVPEPEEGQYEWQWHDISEESYISETLLHSTETNPDYEFTWSPILWAEENEAYTESACCAGSTCWDGDECVIENTWYYYGGSVDDEQDDDDLVAICSDGVWKTGVEEKYDWFHNTDADEIDYCAQEYSCVCSTNDGDDTYCGEGTYENEDGEEVAYVDAGCTTYENFYIEDHLCESQDRDGDGTNEGQWTSRTKVLAFQLLDIANNVGGDFTLFCDNYENVVNNYDQLDAVDNINHVCILHQNDQTIFGVTFNSEDEDNPMIIDEDLLADLLEEGSDGLLDDALDAEITDCSDALSESDSETFGEFHACESSSTVYYNNVINALMYAKDGLDSSVIDYPAEEWQEYFDTFHAIIWETYLTSGEYEITSPDGDTELYEDEYFDAYEHIQDYNTVYYSYVDGNAIFGFEEIKYSDKSSGNRYFMGIMYSGYDIDCEQIVAPYEEAWQIACNEDVEGMGIVLERTSAGSEHWRDLTATLRYE